jgi:fused signal recognition particle receptor
MGLISFLKEKFAHRKEEKEKEKAEKEASAVSEEKKEEPKPEPPAPAKEKPTETVTSNDFMSSEETQPAVSEPVPEVKEPAVPAVEEPQTPAVPEAQPAPTPAKETEAPAEEEKLSKKEQEKAIEDKYVAGLDKSRVGFTDRLKKLANSNKVVNQEYFDSLERILIEADVGVSLSLELIQETSLEASARKITDPKELNDLLIDKMFIGYANKGGSFSTDLAFAPVGPTIVFMCGVNGTGKTTTVAKLAYKYKNRGKKILLVAGDTFRAGAVEQLDFWAKKVGVDILSRPNSDPASLCYDALVKAKSEGYDLVFVDTAGRLQNKKGLMDELSKMIRVMKKVIPEAPHEALLVLDANTGQNGIDQASVFRDSCPLTGIVITKMDGTSKGGIILSIRDQLSLPVKFIGLGEKMDDLEEFDLDKYLYGLLVGDEED